MIMSPIKNDLNILDTYVLLCDKLYFQNFIFTEI